MNSTKRRLAALVIASAALGSVFAGTASASPHATHATTCVAGICVSPLGSSRPSF
jgi:hypothetical protein